METVSEESCSDTTRYALKDPTEARNMGKIDDKVTAKPDIDAYEYTAEGKNELSRYMQVYCSLILTCIIFSIYKVLGTCVYLQAFNGFAHL